MTYDFDRVIDRAGTDSLKYDFSGKRGKPDGILPLWVADMDFPAPPAVLRALSAKAGHGVFGYSSPMEDYFRPLRAWFSDRFAWETRPEWLVVTPGVVFAVATAVRALTGEGDAVLIQQPVYYPFKEMVDANNRRLVVNRLAFDDGRYRIDFDDFERSIVDNKVKLFILCSPHNPVGRVWTREELERLGDICVRHGVTVLADEIHEDFVFPGHRHTVFASIKPSFADCTVTCTAPSKTFNLAGLQNSNIFISNRALCRAFREEMERTGYSQPNIMGLVACKAAYEEGGAWLDALLEYLHGNLSFTREFLRDRLPDIRLIEPEGTYLLWLDCGRLGFSDAELDDVVTNGARLWLDGGPMFGAGGEGFQRVNIACPRKVLEIAYTRLEEALRAVKRPL